MDDFGVNFLKHLRRKNLSSYKVALSLGIDPALLHKIIKGQRRPSNDVLEKLASIPELELSIEQLRQWRAMDEYPELIEKLQLLAGC